MNEGLVLIVLVLVWFVAGVVIKQIRGNSVRLRLYRYARESGFTDDDITQLLDQAVAGGLAGSMAKATIAGILQAGEESDRRKRKGER